MRTEKRIRTLAEAGSEAPEDGAAPEGAYEDGTYEIFRVTCPDCGRPIALLGEDEPLPQHALCPSPWDPFGLTVCQGSGRPASEAAPADDGSGQEQGLTALLTLPEGLDWRTQPFSHAGGPRARQLSGA